MTIPATDEYFSLEVAPSTVSTKTKVRIISAMIAPSIEIPTLLRSPYPFEPKPVTDVFFVISRRSPLPANAPAT